MKPKTRLQLEVWNLHNDYLTEPKHHENFVISNHDNYYTTHYKNLICLECNHQWKPELEFWKEEVAGVSCPSCSKKLKKITINNNLIQRIISYSVVEVVDRFQVFRYFSCWKSMYKNKAPKYYFRSLFEEWKDYDKNKSVIVGRIPTWTGDGFCADYEIRYNKQPVFRNSEYDKFASDVNCPNSEFLPRFKKFELKDSVHDCDWRYLITELERNSKIETLLKAKQKELLYFGVHRDSKHNWYWPQIKIVIRNNYKITDAGIWYDYLDLLGYFKKDLFSPKFICPKDLHKEHDWWMKKKQIILEKERRVEEKLEIIKRQERLNFNNEKYVEQKGKFFDLKFTSDKISIEVLKSIEEFKDEGEELKHCLYTNEYYFKKDYLVLSAKVSGKRTETIEIDLRNFVVTQARGQGNVSTKYHDAILELITQNISKIKRAAIEVVNKENNLTNNKKQAA